MLGNMTKSTTIRLPQGLIDEIDRLIGKGYYQSRPEFITSAIRYTLIFYADLRGISEDAQTSFFRRYTVRDIPQPADFSLASDKRGVTNRDTKPSESQIEMVYHMVTMAFLQTFKLYEGEKVQVSFTYSEGLQNRVRVLNRTKYGFFKKMDFVKVAICCLLTRTVESDKLYDDLDRYQSELEEYQKDVVKKMLKDYLGGEDLDEILSDQFSKLKNDLKFDD